MVLGLVDIGLGSIMLVAGSVFVGTSRSPSINLPPLHGIIVEQMNKNEEEITIMAKRNMKDFFYLRVGTITIGDVLCCCL